MKISRSPRVAALVAALMLAHVCAALADSAAQSTSATSHTPRQGATAPARVGAQGTSGSRSPGSSHDGSQPHPRGKAGGGSSHGASAAPTHATAADNGRDAFAAERTPLNLGSSTTSTTHAASGSSTGSTIVRTIVGLFIVIVVIYGLAWILRQFKKGREGRASGTGLQSVASLPLGQGRSVALVRAGRDLLVVGVGEHGVTPIRRYSEEQAREAGLIAEDDDEVSFAVAPPAARRRASQWRELQQGGATGRVLDTVRRWTVR